MTTQAIIYNGEGLILRSYSGPIDMLTKQLQDGEFLLIGEGSGRYQYVSQGEILDRPVMPITMDKLSMVADGADEIVVTGVPVGALVTFGALQVTATESAITLSTEYPGVIKFSVELFPYQPVRINVNAT